MQASLMAHGLMQNLVVTEGKKGKYYVVAGGRRLTALLSLCKEGKVPKDLAIRCEFVDEAKASELSLAENTVREAMHPADEFEAFAALSANNKPAAMAKRFGVTE